MSMHRIEDWFVLIAVAIGLLLTAILGLWAYMTTTATPRHPDLREVPSLTRSAPLPQWTETVEQGWQIARAALARQNLPGLSTIEPAQQSAEQSLLFEPGTEYCYSSYG